MPFARAYGDSYYNVSYFIFIFGDSHTGVLYNSLKAFRPLQYKKQLYESSGCKIPPVYGDEL